MAGTEGTLLLCAALGGSAGLLLMMLLLWHKVQRPRFILGVPFLQLLHQSTSGSSVGAGRSVVETL